MEQEFLEADIIFPEEDESATAATTRGAGKMIVNDSEIVEPSSSCRFSVPVRIPEIFSSEEEEDYNNSGGGGEMVPPHLVIGRRLIAAAGRRMAYSVCAGKGRTLKGRDLRQVRDSILRMTGFLEGN